MARNFLWLAAGASLFFVFEGTLRSVLNPILSPLRLNF